MLVFLSLKRLRRLLNRKKYIVLSSLLQKACSETGRDSQGPSLWSDEVLQGPLLVGSWASSSSSFSPARFSPSASFAGY